MAWQWSHTQEAEYNVYKNLFTLSIETLAEVLADWQTLDFNDTDEDSSCLENYDSLVEKYKKLPLDFLVDSVWEHMSDWEHGRMCDNGGFNAWVDYNGYVTVPFDLIEE